MSIASEAAEKYLLLHHPHIPEGFEDLHKKEVIALTNAILSAIEAATKELREEAYCTDPELNGLSYRALAEGQSEKIEDLEQTIARLLAVIEPFKRAVKDDRINYIEATPDDYRAAASVYEEVKDEK